VYEEGVYKTNYTNPNPNPNWRMKRDHKAAAPREDPEKRKEGDMMIAVAGALVQQVECMAHEIGIKALCHSMTDHGVGSMDEIVGQLKADDYLFEAESIKEVSHMLT